LTTHLDYSNRAYYNTNSSNWTIQVKGPNGWRKLKSVEQATLYNVYFKVFEAGRQRVLREKRKNVHAYAYFESFEEQIHFTGPLITARYNPYMCDKFIAVPSDRWSPYVTGGKVVILSNMGSTLSIEDPDLICKICND